MNNLFKIKRNKMAQVKSSIFQLVVSTRAGGASNNNTTHLTGLVGRNNLSVRLLSVQFVTTDVILAALANKVMRIESNLRPDFGHPHITFLASHSSSTFYTATSPSFEVPQDGRISLNIVKDSDGLSLADFDCILTFSADFSA